MNTMLTEHLRDPASADVTRAGSVRSELGRFLEAQHAGRMAPRLREALGGGSATCHVLDAKYEPGLRAILLYEYAGHLVRGDLVPDPVGGPVGADVVAPGVRLSRFPHDPEMPTLPSVMDPALLGAALTDALGRASYGFSGAPARCRLQLLRYRPGKRATVLVRLPGDATPYVAKAYHDAAKAAAVAEEAPGLASSFSGGAGPVRIAPTVAYLPDLSVVVQRKVAGVPLDALLLTPRSRAARAGVTSAGRALAEMHRARGVTGRARSVEKELRRFGARAERIGSVDARAGAALGRVAARLLEMHPDLPDPRTGPVHGDCKPSQFLCAGRHLYLMDLDHVGDSDQAADVGTFLASLRQLGVRRALSRAPGCEDLAVLANHFLESYLDAGGHDPGRTRIRWQEAVALQRKALRAFARAPGSPLALALAAEADRCLDRMVEAA